MIDCVETWAQEAHKGDLRSSGHVQIVAEVQKAAGKETEVRKFQDQPRCFLRIACTLGRHKQYLSRAACGVYTTARQKPCSTPAQHTTARFCRALTAQAIHYTRERSA